MNLKFKSNLIGGIFSLVFAIILWIMIPSQISLMNNNAYINARFVPQIVLLIIGLGGLFLIIQSLLGHDSLVVIEIDEEKKGLLYIVILLLYAFLLPLVGYLILTPLLGVLTLLLQGVKKKSYYGVTLGLVAVLYCIFTFLLKIKLP